MAIRANKIAQSGEYSSETQKKGNTSLNITHVEIKKLKKLLKTEPKSLWKYLLKKEN